MTDAAAPAGLMSGGAVQVLPMTSGTASRICEQADSLGFSSARIDLAGQRAFRASGVNRRRP